MSVYVDPVREYGGSATFRWPRSCHMYADTLDELHAMARSLGLRREWFQDKEKLLHYDLVPAKRAIAVSLGAVEHTREQMVQFMRRGAEADGQGSLFAVPKPLCGVLRHDVPCGNRESIATSAGTRCGRSWRGWPRRESYDPAGRRDCAAPGASGGS